VLGRKQTVICEETAMGYRAFASALVAAALLAVSSVAGQADSRRPALITLDESKLPPMTDQLRTRGGVPGPQILLVSPQANGAVPLRHPFKIVIKFMPRDGARVNVASLKVTYLRLFGIDITDRIRPYVTEAGINVDDPQIPAGQHEIRFEIGDSLGRMTTETYRFTVGG
jgi:hypothetical protein